MIDKLYEVFFKRLSLRSRVYLLLGALGLITFFGGVTMIWYSYRMEGLFSQTIEVDISGSQTVEKLLQALIKQKGFVSYYFMDGDLRWLERYDHYHQAFYDHLMKADRLAETDNDRQMIEDLRSKYLSYIESKDRVIALYKAEDRKRGLALHKEVRSHFSELLSLCENYYSVYQKKILVIHEKSRLHAKRVRIIAVLAILAATCLTVFFAFVLLRQILDPIRMLVTEADRFGEPKGSINEIKALRHGVRGLIEESDQTHSELEKSRTRLAHAEKMAMVGKLAAGVAHSIRNPMTSIKMRVFSLEKNLELTADRQEDLEVISEEMKHIDNIVQNFLVYSRPSQIKKQKINPSDIVDMSLRLLHHRLKSQGVEILLERPYPLPDVLGDSDQLKEMLVNLLVNACEAMPKGGRIRIEEMVDMLTQMGPVAVIRVSDNGPGIKEAIKPKVFEPFYSTKEEGTGLGLSITRQVIEQHDGLLVMESKEGEGTTFTITLRCGEGKSWVP